jgi:hypothetical protein
MTLSVRCCRRHYHLEELYAALSAIKTENGIYPFTIFSSKELTPGVGFSGYNTAAIGTTLTTPELSTSGCLNAPH